jgi:hypothetical protein
MKTLISPVSQKQQMMRSSHCDRQFTFALLLVLSLCAELMAAQPSRVKLVRAPAGGIQPQATVDDRNGVHLIFYKGDSAGGDIFYARQDPGNEKFSEPIQVNRQPKSAMAAGTIRGAQLAVGKNGRVHVAWNGHAPEKGAWMEAPMLYTRLNDAGTAFEPERNLITSARGLDGGGSVAADTQGNVYVFWHAPKPGSTNGEAGRAVFVAKSTDDGRSFAPEKIATSKPTGACGCCGLKSFADSQGNVLAFYRAASDMMNRDETLLLSRNRGADFDIVYTHGWKIASCPMSSAFISETKTGILAAGETHGRVFFVRVEPKTGKLSAPISPDVKAKHPVVVGNGNGDTLLVWTEGTAWGKGGAVAWQLYDAAGIATSETGRSEGLPAWSLATAFAKKDGSFVIIY